MPPPTTSSRGSSSALFRRQLWLRSQAAFPLISKWWWSQQTRRGRQPQPQRLQNVYSASFGLGRFRIPVPFHSRRQTRRTSKQRPFILTDKDSHALPLPPKIRWRRQEVRPGLLQMEQKLLSRRRRPVSLPHGRGSRQGRFQHQQFGKLVGRSPSAAGLQTRPWPAQLGLIIDDCSRKRCLLDTGSQVSLWPPSPSSLKLPLSQMRLTADNDTPIKAFGQQRKQIQIGGKSYSFIFLIVQVSRQILGLDFVQNFQMTIDLCNRRLVHSGISTRFSSTSSNISGINVVRSPSPFLHILPELSEITDAALSSSTSRHGVECFINTTGPPFKTSPRPLTPDKPLIAKQYFDIMCVAGVCRRLNSPWSSGLHLGLDFLQNFQMTIDLCNRHLVHSGISTRFSSTSSNISGVDVVHSPSPSLHILREFPEITDAALASSTSCHGVECFINTTGPPVKTSPRPLTPDKPLITKQYFDIMCAAGRLSTFEFALELGPPHGRQERWHFPPMRRLSSPQRAHLGRCPSDSAHPRLRGRPLGLQDLLKDRPH